GELYRSADDLSFKLPKPPHLGVEPELERSTGIYVAGYPGGRSLSIALNSQVVYPFWVEKQEGIVELSELALLRLFTTPADYDAKHLTFAKRVTDFFSSSYKAKGADGYQFMPASFPTIGADPDTKHGDSGAPTFDVSRNSMIGILRAGVPDDAEFP